MIFSKLISIAVMSYVSIYSVFNCVTTETMNHIDNLFDKSPQHTTPATNNNDVVDRFDPNLLNPNKPTYECLPASTGYKERMIDFNLSKQYKSNLTFNEKRLTRHKNFHLIPEKCGLVKKIRRKRIANGTLVKGEHSPWFASIQYKENNKERFGCSGTVINKRYILTAGHCLPDKDPSFSISGVFIGMVNENSIHSTFHEIDSFLRHENFTGPSPSQPKRRRKHDIGLIRLKNEISDFHYYPICLPFSPSSKRFPRKLKYFNFTRGDSKYSCTKFIGVGGADVREEKSRYSEIKYKYFKIIDLETCRRELKCFKKNTLKTERARIIEDEQFCAGSFESGKSLLEAGDSGGPLLYDEIPYYQVGIMSFGANLAKYPPNVSKPDIFQNVHLYLEWILDNIKP